MSNVGDMTSQLGASGVKRHSRAVEATGSRKAAKTRVSFYPADKDLQSLRASRVATRSVASPFGSRHSSICASPSPSLSILADIEAIVINLDRRPDRMLGCTERLQARCPWLKHTRFSACDGRQDPLSEAEVSKVWNTGRNVVYQKQRAVRKGWDDLDSYKVLDLCLSPGERGCAVSHVRAWRHCLERAGGTERPLLVLEDDAAPTADFSSSLERAIAATPADAHVLYLGYSQAAEWRREVSQDVVEAEYVWTTVAYILWPAGARILLDRLPVDQPVDNFMADACAQGAIKAYCIRPKIVLQNDAWNTNSDVAHSDEHYWGADSDIKHSDSLISAVDGTKVLSGVTSSFWDIDSEDSDDNGI